MSDNRYAAPDPVAIARDAVPATTTARVGYLPTRTNRVRDGLAVGLLVIALLLPWNLDVGLGVPAGSTPAFLAILAVTLLAVLAAAAPHAGPLRLSAPEADVARTRRLRLWLCLPYVVCVLAFVAYHLVQTVHFGGTGAVPPGAGPGMWLGIGGALLAGQPPITSTTLNGNAFRRWYAAARLIGVASIALAAWAVVFNLFWRLRYLFVGDVRIGGNDVATVTATLLYGTVAMATLVIASRWLIQKTAAARLATTALGSSAALAGLLVWVLAVGRDVDAFHGIAENTSTNAVGYEGYLAWAAAAAIVAPTTLYAVFLVRPPTLAVYRGAALKCLSLIAFWSIAAAGLRLTDLVINLSLNLPGSVYDSVTVGLFNVFTAGIAVWLNQRLSKGGLTSTVIAAFAALLTVFTAAQLVIGVALALRYADPVPRKADAIYGNDLAHQITSTFDVVVCLLSVAILLAALVTGPLAGFLLRRREKRTAAGTVTPSAPPAAVARDTAAPTVARPRTPPRIARKPDADATTSFSTTALRTTALPTTAPPTGALPQAAPTTQMAPPTTEIPAPTTALRIQRRPEPHGD